MDPRDFYAEILQPGLSLLDSLAKIKVTDEAKVLTMAIAGQESNWAARRQVGGPARSYWQFEKGGGVAGVLSHPASAGHIQKVCTYLDIPCDTSTVYEAMAWNDPLACCMARLLLLTDPAALPKVGEVELAWQYYLRNWRPGAPHHEFWASKYATSRALL